MDMDNDYSSSSDESSDDSYSSEESARLEDCRINGTTIQLPAGLCENKAIFDEFFSYQNLQECFTEQQKRDLLTFLPTFPENDRKEKEETLRKLFSGENMRFGAPLPDFHARLRNGYYRPDIAKMRSVLRRSRGRDNRQRLKIYYSKLVKEILISRQRLLERSYSLPPGAALKMERPAPATPPRPPLTDQRTKRRYFEELTAIRKEIGESDHSSQDDNYPEGPPWRASKKQRRQLSALESTLGPRLSAVTSTLSTRPSGLDLANRVAPAYNPFDTGEDGHRAAMVKHARRRRKNMDHPELWTHGLTLDAVISRTLGRKTGPTKDPGCLRLKKKPRPLTAPATPPVLPPEGGIGPSSNSEIESSDEQPAILTEPDPVPVVEPVTEPVAEPVVTVPASAKPAQRKRAGSLPKPVRRESPKKVKVEPLDLLEPTQQVVNEPVPSEPGPRPATLSDLAGFDMMSLPIDLEGESTSQHEDVKPTLELMQATHCCFFALLRDIICSSSEHRMDLATIEERLRGWQQNPISPLNHWHSLAGDWLQQLPSAVMFLCGEYTEGARDDFVPYLEFKPQAAAYQWIGAGRDSDGHLQPLCSHWLENRDQLASRPIKCEMEVEGDREADREDRTASPPPPRCPTAWAVRPSSAEEKRLFRVQEARRYASPHRAFTFRMHGYESAVGPVKGIYNPAAGGGLKPARGHSLLVTERPGFVTILCLVRDAAARLPNGEGTRTDICELLKDSQYLASIALESYLHSVVSGALDRLHYEADPCVKYDTKRKIWIYLHRGRTEDEFERMHQQFQGVAKTKKTTANRKPNRARKDSRQTSRESDTIIGQDIVTEQPVATLSREPTPPPPATAPVAVSVATNAPLTRPPKVTLPPVTQATNTLLSGGSLVSATQSAPIASTVKTVTLTAQQVARSVARLPTPPRMPLPARGPNVVTSPSVQAPTSQAPARVQSASSSNATVKLQQTASQQPIRMQQSSAVPPIRVQQSIRTQSPGTVQPVRAVQQVKAATGVPAIRMQTPGTVQPVRVQQASVPGVQQIRVQQTSTTTTTTITTATQPIRITQTNIGGVQQIKVQQTVGGPIRMQQQGGVHPIKIQQGGVQPIRVQQGGVQPIRVQQAAAGSMQQLRGVQPIRVQQPVSGQPGRVQQSVRVQQAGAGGVQQIRVQQTGGVLPIRAGQATTATTSTTQARQVQFVTSPGAMKTAIRVANPAAAAAMLKSKQQKQLMLQRQTATEIATTLANQQQASRQKAKVTALAQMQQLRAGGALGKVQLPAQVLSVESLLAHQKQGTTLRVSGVTGAGTSLIQIPSCTPGGQPQYAVVSQGATLRVSGVTGAGTSLIQIPSCTPGGQPQYAVVSQGSLVSVGQPRLLQQQMAAAGKLKAGGANVRVVATPGTARPGNLRVTNPTGLNLATVAGKPVLLASKAQVGGQQNVYLTTQAGAGGQQTVVLSQALRGQGGHLVLQPGGTPQILLPPGFQGGTLNIKTLQGLQGLQGLKVIPMPQGSKGRQQVYARIINPGARPTAAIQPQASTSETPTPTTQAPNPSPGNEQTE